MFPTWGLSFLPLLYLFAFTAAAAVAGDGIQRQPGLVAQQQQRQQQQQHVLGGHTESPPLSSSLSQAHRFSFLAPSRPLTGFAAFGDSYSAGIGTGVEGKEDDCRHGLHAHPRLIATDFEVSQGGSRGSNVTAFQALSCTGATTAQVLSGGEGSQIDAFVDTARAPADFALLSLGGNDLGFFAVMNACVFRFYSFYSGACEAALEAARARIEDGAEFEHRLELVILEILDKARWERKPWFFVTVTGYARFFNDVTDACNDMSFGVWWGDWGCRPTLTKSLRIRMNSCKQFSGIFRINYVNMWGVEGSLFFAIGSYQSPVVARVFRVWIR